MKIPTGGIVRERENVELVRFQYRQSQSGWEKMRQCVYLLLYQTLPVLKTIHLKGARFSGDIFAGGIEMRSERTRKLTTLAMLSAIAYIIMVLIKIPVFPAVEFLKYEPKDVIIAIGGFLYGPLSAMAMSAVVALVEMVTVSTTGIYGAIMNFLSSCTFACTAAFIYKKWRKLPGAAAGLAGGIIITVPVMLLWDYLIVPIYMGAPREVVATMLVPYFLPFNLLKYGLSAAITMLLYKPIRIALSKSRMLPVPSVVGVKTAKINIGAVLISALIIVTCVLLILSWQGVI